MTLSRGWVALLLLVGSSVSAAEYTINAVVTSWAPQILYVQPGDTVKWAQMAGHDTETIPGMLPAGAAPWKAQMGEDGFTVRLIQEGVYLYRCNPHMTAGMVGAIVVGEGAPKNLAGLEKEVPNMTFGKSVVGRLLHSLTEDLQSTGHVSGSAVGF